MRSQHISMASMLIALLILPAVTQGAVVVTAESKTIIFSENEVQTGSLEIFIQSDEATAPDLVDWQIVLISENPAITFTGAGKPVDHSYVLGNSGSFFGSSLLNSGASIKGADSGFVDSEPLNDGSGFLRVDFEIAAGTPLGTYQLVFSMDPNDTFLSNLDGDLAISSQAATISIIVPEPASLVLAVIAFAGLFGFVWRRRQQAL